MVASKELGTANSVATKHFYTISIGAGYALYVDDELLTRVIKKNLYDSEFDTPIVGLKGSKFAHIDNNKPTLELSQVISKVLQKYPQETGFSGYDSVLVYPNEKEENSQTKVILSNNNIKDRSPILINGCINSIHVLEELLSLHYENREYFNNLYSVIVALVCFFLMFHKLITL